MKKKIISFSLAFCLMFSTAFAHSGRTDSNGGHKDNNNVSGLGYYHYHCGGNPAHLHFNGYCPYKTSSSQTYNYVSSVAPTTPQPVVTVSEPTTFNVIKTTYPVKINNQDISNFASGWPPFIYEDITYIPLTSYLVNALNLKLNFNNVEGLDLSAQFYDTSKEKDLFYAYKYLDDARDNITEMNEYISQAMGDYLDTFHSGSAKKAAESFITAYNEVEANNSNLMSKKTTFTDICLSRNILNQYEINEFYNDMEELHKEYNNMKRKISNGLNSKKLVDVTSTYGDTLDILFDLQKQIDGLKNKIYNTIYGL
jgi:hypothetical protein